VLFPILILSGLAGIFSTSLALAADARTFPCKPDAKWTEPAPPLRIHGDTWFVGSCGLSSILITSPRGHILIDGGVEEAAALIEASISAAGFRLEDVRYILHTHEHYDHVGGIARLQRDSGAVVLAREPAATALERGHGDRSDPQFLIAKAFPPVANVKRIEDLAVIRSGALALTAHATPGHTPGSTTWTWQSCENGRCLDIVYADSLSAISDDVYRYSDTDALGTAMRHSIETIRDLPCDILLTPHPDASAMWTRVGATATAPLIDAGACLRYAADASANLGARLARERDESAP